MSKYVFREDEPLRIKAAGNANPQTIGEALGKIAAECEGELAPRAVVEAARKPRHPIHQHFEWDDTIAAEQYRIDQARNLIRVVRVIDTEATEGTTRAFISINVKEGVSYRAVADVKQSADLQLAVMAQADRDLEAFTRRYRELADICEIVGDAREKLKVKRTTLENRAA